MLAEKFFLVLETLRSHASDDKPQNDKPHDNKPQIVTSPPRQTPITPPSKR
jgi:hypothetical protein